MNKLLCLFFVSSIYPMQSVKEFPTLVSLCVKILDKEIREKIIDRECIFLAYKIDIQFPLKTINTCEQPLDFLAAITTLNKISHISHENDLVRIAPISIDLKQVPRELSNKVTRPHEWESVSEIEKKVFEKLYDKSLIVKHCMNVYIYYQNSAEHSRIIRIGEDIPVVMQLFSTIKNLEARDARDKKREKYAFDDSWCP